MGLHTGQPHIAVEGYVGLDVHRAARVGSLGHGGQVRPENALSLGFVLSAMGVYWSIMLSPLYGIIVFSGIFCDVIIYTIWLKRRTCCSILWGGIAGGIPVLAGRALGIGSVDWVGVALAMVVLFWIPTHILTFSLRYVDDYRRAGVPNIS